MENCLNVYQAKLFESKIEIVFIENCDFFFTSLNCLLSFLKLTVKIITSHFMNYFSYAQKHVKLDCVTN